MNSDRHTNDPEQGLFEEALERSAGPERIEWLKNACGDDEPLLRRLEALLRAHEEEDGFLPDAQPTLATPPTERPGERIGHYKLLQQIGEGGFGTVWMAEQMEPVSRRVALKIIKLGMDTQEVIARFEAERQALAMMDHPHIATVLDAGATDKGRPFFVMELVKGLPITQYCDEKQLGMRERLELFGDVCSAINHAHQKGVIHRDIKPSNVMVTLHGDKAVVKVIDFGVAKATQGKLTEKTLFTRFEQFIGTPVYMSPEQAALSGLDIDTRSDIYALGILLYELLTGKPPFDAKSLASAGYEEMRRIIREVEPQKPSSRLSTVIGDERTTLAKARHIEPGRLSRMVEPDLDWIVMKAIEKDRARRYETANGLALDIQRFLADEPVSATPPSAGYKFRKFARRNKTSLRVAAGVAVVLVAATAVSTWQAIQAKQAEQQATVDAFRATQAEKRTAETLMQVSAERDAKDLARKDAEDISKFLSEVFQSPDPARDGREIKVAELLKTAARKLETDLTAQPAQRAKLQATLASTYLSLGIYQEAIPLQEKVRVYSLATFGLEHPDTIKAMHVLANCFDRAGREDEALKLREEVLALSRKVNGPKHVETIRAMINLASSYDAAQRFNEELTLAEAVAPLSREVNGPEHDYTLKAISVLSTAYNRAGRPNEALTLREDVLRLRRKANGDEHPDTLRALHELAVSYLYVHRLEEALKLQEEALRLSRKVNGPEHPDTISPLTNLAVFYRAAGREDKALPLQEEALRLCRNANAPDHPSTLLAMSNLAFTFGALDRQDEAIALFQEVLAINRKVHGQEHTGTLTAMSSLGYGYEAAGRMKEAVKVHEEALALSRKLHGPESWQTIAAMDGLAAAYGKDGGGRKAITLGEEALALARRVLPAGHERTIDAMEILVKLYRDVDLEEKAASLEADLKALTENRKKPDTP